MPGGERRATIGVVREAVRRAVAATSLRGVAREVGMSAPGLQHFMEGGVPFRGTMRKLMAWYTRGAHARGEVTEEVARTALALLMEGLPEGERDAMERKVVGVLRSLYVERGLPPPPWTEFFGDDGAEAGPRPPLTPRGGRGGR